MPLIFTNRNNGNGKLDLLQRGSSLGGLRMFTVSTGGGGGGGLDADATAFIDAAGITNETQKSAINTLVTDLKAYGIWTKMKAIYPFVGGTATTHKWNLKDPRDLDAAFRLTFSGGWTHSTTGALPNGSNAYANTYFQIATHGLQNSGHLSFYSRTNDTSKTGMDIGEYNSGPWSYIFQDARFSPKTRDYRWSDTGAGGIARLENPARTDGYFVASRRSVNDVEGYRNAITDATASIASTAPSSNRIFIGAGNAGGSASLYSARECAFASIGEGLTDSEVANLNTAVQTYQTTLGRQV